ncbi:MAG: WD40/YVTN/BNR-like repeat-containing protein, partial [Dongiaceae bacterium]
LAISPLDADGVAVDGSTPTSKLVIYAGTGTSSSASDMFDAAGAPNKIGILRSMDGGATWQFVGKELQGSTIRAIEVLPNGDVLVGTDGTGASEGGLFRSIDNAETFDDIVALTDGTADPFPKGAVDDIELDPANPQRAYASVARQGVFISNDSGASWAKVSNGLGEMQYARRIMLAVSPSLDGANHPIYAAILARAQRLTAVANADALTFQVGANTVLQAGDEIIFSATQDGLDNDGANGPDDPGEKALEERWKIATIGAIVNGNRTITLQAADADGLDNDGDGTIDAGTETGRPNNGLFRQWELGANVLTDEGDQHRVAGLFRSDNLGVNWTALAQPGLDAGAGGTNFEGPTTSAQGDTHFSMVVDPLDPDIVFIGGDTHETLPAGADDFAGRLLRGNTNTGVWQLITDGGANNTAPHADSREMVFRGLHIVEVDDGGIYELRNANAGARVWRSLNADLTLTEIYSLAFDPVNNVILAGTQDNGTPLQSAPGSLAWNALDGGDGAIVQTSGDLLYFSNEELRDFRAAGTPILAATTQDTDFLIVAAGTPFQVGDTLAIHDLEPVVESIEVQP